MDTMERLHLFSTRRTRERAKQAAFEAATMADFEAGQVAMRSARDDAAAISPAEKSEAQSRSNSERRKFTPAV
jgi:hypothetical protein